MKEQELIDHIKNVTHPVDNIEGDFANSFQWLSNEIYMGKDPLNSNSVHFIIVNILNRQHKTRDIRRQDYFNVYVVGEFRKTFTPVFKVAEALAIFYSEIFVLPNIIPLPKHLLKKDKDLLQKLKNGVVIYERR